VDEIKGGLGVIRDGKMLLKLKEKVYSIRQVMMHYDNEC